MDRARCSRVTGFYDSYEVLWLKFCGQRLQQSQTNLRGFVIDTELNRSRVRKVQKVSWLSWNQIFTQFWGIGLLFGSVIKDHLLPLINVVRIMGRIYTITHKCNQQPCTITEEALSRMALNFSVGHMIQRWYHGEVLPFRWKGNSLPRL